MWSIIKLNEREKNQENIPEQKSSPTLPQAISKMVISIRILISKGFEANEVSLGLTSWIRCHTHNFKMFLHNNGRSTIGERLAIDFLANPTCLVRCCHWEVS